MSPGTLASYEKGTLARLRDCRIEVIIPIVARHSGRIVKVMGDGVLAEFAGTVDAVQSALDIQKAMARRNDNVPGIQRMPFRIGVHLGDVIVDGDDVY
jgi:adenylate cyclase